MIDEADRLIGLSAFAQAASTCATVQELVERVASTALALVGGDSVSICRLEPAHGRIRVLHNAGDLADWEQRWPADETYRLNDHPQVMTTVGGLRPWWTGSLDNPETVASDREVLQRLGKHRAASFQVVVGDAIWGDIYLTRTVGADFDPVDVATAMTLAGLLAAGLSRLELLAEMSQLAYTDPLTGLANRRAADDWLEQRLTADEPFPPVTVVLCDINGLKPVNDIYGHAAGDEMIRRVARHLVAISSELASSMVARIGGDEFVVLLDGPNQHEVECIVERLATVELPHGGGVAVGAASATRRPAGDSSAKTAARALLRLADAAQYRHKQTRRVSTDALSPTAAPISVLLPSGEFDVSDRVLAALEASPDQGALSRLAIVAQEVARAFGVASWWVSREDDGQLVDVLGMMLRRRSDEVMPLNLVSGQEFLATDYPATRAALEGGGYYASLTEGHEAERALIARMGYVSALAVGDRADDGTGWLVELFGDGQTSSGVFVALPLLRALVHIAVRGATDG